MLLIYEGIPTPTHTQCAFVGESRERRLRRDAVRAANKGNTLTDGDDQSLLAAFSRARKSRENNHHPFHAQVVMK